MLSIAGIPPSRIRLLPTPGTATEEDVFRVRREEGILCEIFDGVLVEKPMGQHESIIAIRIAVALSIFIEVNEIDAEVSGADTHIRLLRRQLRMPDACVIFRSQFASGEYPTEAVWPAYPDLAVEVLSERNTPAEMDRKLHEYFEAGCPLAWVVDPDAREVAVYTSPTNPLRVDIGGMLDGGNVLPGLQLAVSKIFRE